MKISSWDYRVKKPEQEAAESEMLPAHDPMSLDHILQQLSQNEGMVGSLIQNAGSRPESGVLRDILNAGQAPAGMSGEMFGAMASPQDDQRRKMLAQLLMGQPPMHGGMM
jgi:hypothetical protein